MSYEVAFSRVFKKNIKDFKKQFAKVADDVTGIIKSLQDFPYQGDAVPGGKGVRKIRVNNSNMNKGKSGGYRVLYYVVGQEPKTLYFLMIYAKNEQEDVPVNKILAILKEERLL